VRISLVAVAGAAAVIAGVALAFEHSSGAGASRAGTTVAGARAAGPAVAACKPTARHPYPVVLVPGTIVVTTWNVVAPALTKQGYCVYKFEYGNYGTAEIGQSAKKLATYVDAVLAKTHAKKVSIVGHSQGGMMPRYYIKFLHGAGKVDDLIGLSPSNHGTENPMIVATGLACPACDEQLWGSAFLAKLNRGSETPAPVDYTVVQTLDDVTLVPYTSAFLNGPRSRVTNITIQNDCPSDFVTHLGMPSDSIALQWIENALGRKGPASPAFNPHC
jgi:triacylglycerol lipase